MKNLLYILCAILLAACTNNGEIGDFYGEWAIDQITVDNTPDRDIPVEDYYWKFQNNIIQITKKLPYNDFLEFTATWRNADGKLYLNLTHNKTATVPAEILLPAGKEVALDILSISSSSMHLQYTDSLSRTIGYRLRKLK